MRWIKNKLFLIFLLVSCNLQAQILENDICAKSRIHQQKMMKTAVQNAAQTAFDFTYADISWKVDPAVRFIQGKITYVFTALEDSRFVYLQLDDELVLDTVISSEGLLDQVRESQYDIEIDLGKDLSAGESDTITVIYHGSPPSNGFGSFGLGENDSGPALWTLSEPYGARDWWPAYQNLQDKIDSIDIRIQVPEEFETGSNGKLVEVLKVGNEKVYHWKHRHPIAIYLVAIAVANYEELKDTVSLTTGDLPLLNLLYPETVNSASGSINAFPDFFQWLDSLLIPYPYMNEKYGHAQFGWGGGMEHQTMSFMGGFGFEIMIHEAAHQWYGDLVTCGSWHDIWLNEGFATYLTAIAYERFHKNTFWPIVIPEIIDYVTSKPDGSVYVYDTTSVDRIFNYRLTYRKAAMVLHMLRWEMGDKPFFQGIRDYLLDPEFHYAFATTAGFQKKMEAAAGRSLETFFQNWIYKQGYPSYTVNWQQKAGKLKLEIRQKTSHISVDFFEMHVPLLVHTTQRDTTLRLWHENNGQTWEMPINEKILSIEFDPEPWLLSNENRVFQIPNDRLSIGISTSLAAVTIASLNPFLELDGLEVYDMAGRKVISIENPETFVTLSTSEWAAGYYLVRMTADEREATRLFQVIR